MKISVDFQQPACNFATTDFHPELAVYKMPSPYTDHIALILCLVYLMTVSVYRNLGPGVSSSSKLKSLSNSGLGSTVGGKSGPMKAFNSPEPPKSGPIRTHSAGKTKYLTTQKGRQTHHQINDRLTSAEIKSDRSINQRTSEQKSASSSLGKYQVNLETNKKHKDNDISGDKNIRLSQNDQIHTKSKLEAVVTLSKGKTGDATDVHVIPSAPPSAKPTTPRPGSAQKFRKMVLDCRDAS